MLIISRALWLCVDLPLLSLIQWGSGQEGRDMQLWKCVFSETFNSWP